MDLCDWSKFLIEVRRKYILVINSEVMKWIQGMLKQQSNTSLVRVINLLLLKENIILSLPLTPNLFYTGILYEA